MQFFLNFFCFYAECAKPPAHHPAVLFFRQHRRRPQQRPGNNSKLGALLHPGRHAATHDRRQRAILAGGLELSYAGAAQHGHRAAHGAPVQSPDPAERGEDLGEKIY